MKIIFAIVMIAVSILFISIGVDTWTTYRNAQNYEQATAVVTGNECQMDMTGPNTYTKNCAEYQFQTKDGKTISFGRQIPQYQVGQHVLVYYDPRDPAYTVEMANDMKSMPVAMVVEFILGILFIVMGLLPLVRSIVKSRRAASNNMRSTHLKK